MATSGAPCTLTRMGMDVSRSSGRDLRILALPAWLTAQENTRTRGDYSSSRLAAIRTVRGLNLGDRRRGPKW
jgi:hypothetical protein